MKKHKIYITEDIPTEVEKYIAKYCDYEKWEGTGVIPKNELLKKLKDIEGLLLMGLIINEEALIYALENKQILGAGLNVFEIEPVKTDNPFLK